ncbi:M48 family metalloprotease [Aquabacterium lacunae]|nr:M48 family metalloprotease [Aquabacterium lacunae]
MSRLNRLNRMSRIRPTLLATLVISLALTGCGTQVRNPVTGQLQRTVMDEKQEVATGSKNHQEILKEYGQYPDAKLQAYVNEVGQKLAKQSHRAELTWHFTVLDSPVINAFALPGGYVYITRGLMAYLDSEADLAGVLGHEIGHVTARHGAQQATQQQTASIGVLAASVLGAVLEAKGVSGAGRMASDVSQSVASGLIASHSREHETEADRLGAEYLARSRYNPANMVDVIQVLKNQESHAADQARAQGRQASGGNDWLATHPSNDKRLQDIREVAARYPGPDQGRYADDGRQRYLAAIQDMAFGDSPEQGLVRGAHFLHPGLGIALTAPPGWRIQNGADTLTVATADGNAALVMKLAPASAGRDHARIIQQALQPTAGRTQPSQLNGLNATRFMGQRRNSQGQVQEVQATVVDGPKGQVYLLVPMARNAQAYSVNGQALAAAEGSFRPLGPADQALAKPWVVVKDTFPKTGWSGLVARSALAGSGSPAEPALRLLNGYYGGGEPQVGASVKNVVAKP